VRSVKCQFKAVITRLLSNTPSTVLEAQHYCSSPAGNLHTDVALKADAY
jgi:hypothetical protein